MDPFTVITVAGLGLSTISKFRSANARKRAGKQDQLIKNMQADQTLLSAERRIDILERESEQLKGVQRVSFAARGVSVGEGAPLSLLEETNRLLVEEQTAVMNQAQFDADMLRRGGDIAAERGRDRARAERIGAFANLLEGAAPFIPSPRGQTTLPGRRRSTS